MKAERKVDKNPSDQEHRDQLFVKSKEYRAIKRAKKGKFLYEMNSKINGPAATTIDWNALKKLSEQNMDEEQFDIYDLISFTNSSMTCTTRNVAKNLATATMLIRPITPLASTLKDSSKSTLLTAVSLWRNWKALSRNSKTIRAFPRT